MIPVQQEHLQPRRPNIVKRGWVYPDVDSITPYMRTVKTASGATAVRVMWSPRRGTRQIEHVRSAHNEAEPKVLKAAVQQRIAAGQLELDLGLDGPSPSGLPPVTSSKMSHLVNATPGELDNTIAAEHGQLSDISAHIFIARIVEPVDTTRDAVG